MRGAIARAVALGAALLAPLFVLAKGYLPQDDALRHVAKAITGRPWTEILLLRPEITLDSNPGWHALLSWLHHGLGLGSVDLLVFSIVFLSFTFTLGPILLLRRPEAWLIALALLAVVDPWWVGRLMLGRPFLLTSAIVPLVGLLWSRLEERRPWPALGLFTLCGGVACWMHGSYYLLALPVAALLAAGHFRAGGLLAGTFALGTGLGALLTGHPLAHLWQMVLHGYLAVGRPHPDRALAGEFQPFDGQPLALAGLLVLLVWRSRARPDALPARRDPMVILMAGSWALGFVALRFWSDWSAPALLTLAAIEIQGGLERRMAAVAPERPLVAAGAAALVLLTTTANVGHRWSDQPPRPFLSSRNAAHRPWLPDRGGIAYSADMGVFFSFFFANPDAPWKYVLGFEPALMRDEDYAVLSDIVRSMGLAESYLPWLRRMRPEDRFYVFDRSNRPPPLPALEWFQPAYGIWAGRLPRQTPGATGPGTAR